VRSLILLCRVASVASRSNRIVEERCASIVRFDVDDTGRCVREWRRRRRKRVDVRSDSRQLSSPECAEPRPDFVPLDIFL